MNHRILAVVAVVGISLGAAACSSNSSSSTSATSTAKTTTTMRTTTTTTTRSTTTTTTAKTAACSTKTLTITAGQQNGAAGHIYVPIVFKNTSSSPCIIAGYPGVAATGAGGAQLAQASRSTTVPVTTITLAAGASASATVGAVDVPSGTETTCPADYTGLLVTPPNDTVSVPLTLSLPACPGLSVTAVSTSSPS